MALQPDRVAVVSFDSFSTLVDPTSAADELVDVVDDPDTVARRWHPLAVRYAIVTNYIDAYRPYYDLHRDALAYLLEARGVRLPEGELDRITAAYHDLDPFDDVPGSLRRLHDAGYELAIVSNGDPEMLESLLSGTGTDDVVTTIVSADEIETFKPASELYEYAAGRIGVSTDRIAHVGAGWMDVMGCMHAGMQGIWIDRRGLPWPRFAGHPDLTVDSLHDLADTLDA